MGRVTAPVKIADEVWIAAALLHREHPERPDFTVREIVDRARREGVASAMRPGVYVHAVQHCVANRRPNPGRYRMLVETGRSRRRLFRPGDPYHPDREGAKCVPAGDEIPARYRDLLTWYHAEYAPRRAGAAEAEDALLALRGSGEALWAGEPADRYVQRLRRGWT